MKNTGIRIRIRKAFVVAALAGSVVTPATLLTATPASAAAFENMPPA